MPLCSILGLFRKNDLIPKNTHLGDTHSGKAHAVWTIPRHHAEEALQRRGHLSYDSVSADVQALLFSHRHVSWLYHHQAYTISPKQRQDSQSQLPEEKIRTPDFLLESSCHVHADMAPMLLLQSLPNLSVFPQLLSTLEIRVE